MRLVIVGRQLELDVVGVAEGQDQQAEGLPQVGDFTVRDASFVQQLPGTLQRIAVGHAEAEVIESNARLIEAIIAGSAMRIRTWTDAETDAPIAEEDAGRQI